MLYNEISQRSELYVALIVAGDIKFPSRNVKS